MELGASKAHENDYERSTDVFEPQHFGLTIADSPLVMHEQPVNRMSATDVFEAVLSTRS